jgi:hypothetical protein
MTSSTWNRNPNRSSDSDAEAVVAGTLRSRKWEELIVESSVVGGARARTAPRAGEDGSTVWRLISAIACENCGGRTRLARIARLERDLRNLQHLRQFALPIIEELAEWPERAVWREWLDRFASLAVGALARPTRVLQTLADLRPMESVGPVALEEARDVLHDRLVTLDWEPPVRRYGRLFVGTPHQARGRRFRVVFVPGLAERVVPQRPREDPLLLDDRRRDLDPALMLQEARGTAERLLLKIAIGAAAERLYLRIRLARCERGWRRQRRIRAARSRDGCRIIACSPRKRRRRAMPAWRGRRRRTPIARLTTSNTTWRSSNRCSTRAR